MAKQTSAARPMTDITRCPRCGVPTHASESDDSGYCAKCSREVPMWQRGLDMTESNALSKRLRTSQAELQAIEHRKSYREPLRVRLEETQRGVVFVHVSPGVAYGNVRRVQSALKAAGMDSGFSGTAVYVHAATSKVVAALVAAGFEVA